MPSVTLESVDPHLGPWTYAAPVLLLAVVMLRNARTRTLRIERLWITPTLLLALAALVFARSAMPGPVGLGLDAGALALGALLGWWRGRASRFTIDPETHVITSRVSAAGMLLILAIFALRFFLRGAAISEASTLHVTAAEVTDSFLLLALGVVSAQRLEWLLRARKMLDAARARSVTPAA